jgi:hypothetical protein
VGAVGTAAFGEVLNLIYSQRGWCKYQMHMALLAQPRPNLNGPATAPVASPQGNDLTV